MADIPSNTWPENKWLQEIVAYVKTAESLWVCKETWKVVYDTKNCIATIFIKWKTKTETFQLSEDFRKAFIQKLKQLPDYNWSKVQEAIEKWTIEIKKIPNRKWYAIYESKTWNLVYITRLDGATYTNIDKYRTREMLSDFFEAWYLRKWYWKIELDPKTWLWKLYKKDWKEVPIFSDEYATATLNAINTMWEAVDYFDKLIKEKEAGIK